MKDLAEYIPVLKYYTRTTQTWAAAGNTHTVTNVNVKADSIILIHHLDIASGNWKIVCSAGSFTITSSDSENASPTFRYAIL